MAFCRAACSCDDSGGDNRRHAGVRLNDGLPRTTDQLPGVRGSAIDGHGWSAGAARNPLQIIELEVVARAGIEPATRGFSVARSGRFGTSKPKIGEEFPLHRPNHLARPSAYRTLGAKTDGAAP